MARPLAREVLMFLEDAPVRVAVAGKRAVGARFLAPPARTSQYGSSPKREISQPSASR